MKKIKLTFLDSDFEKERKKNSIYLGSWCLKDIDFIKKKKISYIISLEFT